MKDVNYIDKVSDIRDEIKKLNLVLDTLLENNEFFENEKPTSKAICVEAFNSNAPKSLKNTFDYIVGYNQTITLLYILKDYADKISELSK